VAHAAPKKEEKKEKFDPDARVELPHKKKPS